MPPEIRKQFDPIRLVLERRPQGIQASAGTGKTYSIAFLAIRMVLEQDIGIGNMLMVTFTNAAVAELQVRVRSFIRKALKVARDPFADIRDDQIKLLVRYHLRRSGEEVVRGKLERASLLLEELQVCTIHSFCMKVLGDFSFETGEVFDAEMMSSEEWNRLLEDQLNRFWRKEVVSLPPVVLKELLANAGIDNEGVNRARSKVLKLVKEAFSGKRTYVWGPSVEAMDEFIKNFLAVCQSVDLAKPIWYSAIEDHWEDLRTAMNANKDAENNFGSYFENKDRRGFADALYDLVPSKVFAQKVSATVSDEYSALREAEDKVQEYSRQLISLLAASAYRQSAYRISVARKEHPARTFDDLVSQLKKSVDHAENLQLMRTGLRDRYQAVFIDEFQDTDGDQYSIFKALFGDAHFLYYIGDPKQSIYGFRKADIETYLKAMDEVEILHQMNINRRSSPRMIKAMNRFFDTAPELDPFGYGDKMPYIKVSSPLKNEMAELLEDGVVIPAIRFSKFQNKSKLSRSLVALVHNLIHSKRYVFLDKSEPKTIKPSDIGILVKSNKTGKAIRKKLAAAGIAAMTIDDTKVLQSPEAKQLYRVLMAIQDRTRSAVNLAMLTALSGVLVKDLMVTSEEKVMERFRTYHETWIKAGVYVMLQQFLADYKVFSRYYDAQGSNPERTISNILQLADILHRVSTEGKLSPADQLRWLKKRIDGSESEGDEYIQRLERDEQAVKIVTIHKSKGLEYPIIICPELNFTTEPMKGGTASWREDNEFLSVDSGTLGKLEGKKELFSAQRERENRRLLYVAVTRARQACFILFSGPKTSTIGKFYEVLAPDTAAGPDVHIQTWQPPDKIPQVTPQAQQVLKPVYSEAVGFSLTGTEWRKASFSGLSPAHGSPAMPKAIIDGLAAYDVFAFNDLRRGSRTGDMLHDILEQADFTRPDTWPSVVERMVSRYQPRFRGDDLNNLCQMLTHVTSVKLLPESDFTLSTLSRARRKVELEFDYKVDRFRLGQLSQLLGTDTPVRLQHGEMEGLMNGFIDLLFEAEGKYYILDWKSNYLGDKLTDYGYDRMHQAMEDNNYHLQYHIYLIAATRYLRQRIRDFDYDTHFGGVHYLFLRGIRVGSDTGVYFTRPTRERLEAMEKLFLAETVG